MATITNEPAVAMDLHSMVRANARKSRRIYADVPGRKRIRLDPDADPDLNKEGLSLRLNAEYADVQTLPEPLASKQSAAAAGGVRKKGAAKKPGDAPTASEEKARKMIEDIQENKSSRNGGSSGPQTGALVHVLRPQTKPAGVTRNLGQQLIRTQDVDAHPQPEWHAPWKLMRVVSGHLGWVRALAVEPGNKWFASGAGDRTIKIWDMVSGQLRLTLTGHISTVRGLAISPRHPYLFSVGEDKLVKCFDLETNKVIRHYHGHLSGVYTVDLHPTLDVLVTGGRDGVARVWDMRTRSNIHVLSGHTGTVTSLRCQEADPQVITGSLDSTVRLWDLAAGKTSSYSPPPQLIPLWR